MKIKDTLQRDPAANPLVNHGQARIDAPQEELKGELSVFVCEGQYAEGVQKIVRSFLDGLGRTSQRGAWVSGFFGSGKSHLLKMLCHLWQDTALPGGASARNLVPAIPDDLRALLRELDTAGKRAGGLIAAAGALPSGTNENVRLTILGILLRAVGLPEQYPQARFCLWLKSNGWFDKVKANIEAQGRSFEKELNNLYVSGPLMRAILECDPKFAAGEAEAKPQIRAQFPPQPTDITTGDFLAVAKEALRLAGRDGRLPCTLLVLDEAQQYIGDSVERSVLVTEVTEAVSKQFEGHVMVVAAGQSALTDVELLQKLMDRFTIRVPLSDIEVETVTRKVLLQKLPSAIPQVKALLGTHAGEISRQLQGTGIAEAAGDRDVIADDYPLLPVRRRFWEHCFRQIDAAGTSSQLRSQLRIIHDAVAKLSDKPLGAIVPADDLFDALAPDMVNTGVLLREINERIIQVGKSDGSLAQRICGLVFLIGKLKREGVADIGVRATKEHVADLLVDDLNADNTRLRSQVDTILQSLAERGVLMQVGDEYRLQTREGTDWDREFRNRQTKLLADDKEIQFRRDQLLYGEADRVVRGLRLTQGASKEARSFAVHRDQTALPVDGATIPIWIRDGWSCTQKEVEEAARGAGIDSPVLFVFIPRQSAEDLRRRIVEADAAEQTINAKGNPTTGEGQEARASMEGRRAQAVNQRDRLARDIIAATRVFQGGGSEVMLTALEDRVRSAAEAALIRLFPQFKEADSGAWEAVIKRAKDGADQPFLPLGHNEATEKHAVCQQVNATVGSGKTGTDVRKALRASPFGWPQDAVDAALIALHRSQHLSATLNGAAVTPGQLDQNKIAKAAFRVENATLTVPERLALRALYGKAGITCKSGEEATKAVEFLTLLKDLAAKAGGAAPLPTVPATIDIEDLQRLVGNEQLLAIKAKAADLEERIKTWQAAGALAATRVPGWRVIEQLARKASAMPEARADCAQVEAIRTGRMLLAPTDPVAPLRLALAKRLRDAVVATGKAHTDAYTQAVAGLASNEAWSKLAPADHEKLLTENGLIKPESPDVTTDDHLLASLEARPLDAMRNEIDAIPARIAQAAKAAAIKLTPSVQIVPLESATLRSEADVDAWLARQKSKMLKALSVGPVMIQQ